MSIHFHSLKIAEIKKETDDCVSVLFDVPEDLKETFQFKQGQSINLRTYLNDEEIRRTYSICSSPLEKKLCVAVKKVEGGRFSTYANEALKKGDVLEVMPPVGNFYTELNPDNKKNYLAFAAGSGITPVLSIIKTTLQSEPESFFTLVFGNRNKNSIIFKEELEALKDKYISRFRVIHVLSREQSDTLINYGRIDNNKLNELNKLIDYNRINEFFICGPEPMIFSTKEFLEKKGINPKHIHFELFNTSGKKAVSQPIEEKNAETAISKINVTLDGIHFDFEIPLNDDTTILQGAIQQGADVPFACKGGMCCTCKAKLLEGKVEMDVHWGLEDEEVEKGYILTCQSHPRSEKVVIDYDIK